MGDKSIHLSASLGIGRKPKDGKDGESVTILYTNVSYQVSDSPTKIPQSWEGSITNVKQTDAKPYLWTKTEVHYNVAGKDTITYSVSYKGKDGTNGTSFTPKGMATAYYHQADRNTFTKEGIYLVDIYTTASNEQKPYVITRKADGSISYIFAEFGDGYNVGGHLYVANAEKWVDFGKIQGAKGEKGEDGKDAINIVFSPAELVFDADENGNLIQAEKSAEVKVFRGNKQLTYLTDWDFPSIGKQTGDNCKASFMVEENSSPLKPIAKIYDISSTPIANTDPQANVPASSGGINVPIKIGDVTYNAYLSFSVNVNTFAHTLIEDNKKYISKYTEVSNKYDSVSSELDNKANKNDMEDKISTISQKADNIKLEVLSKTSGRRNMLVNSAFRNQDSVFIHSLARIEKNTGVDGVNCIHSSDKYSGDGDGNYIGAFWDSTQKNGVVTNIPIVKGKKYVISCWIKSDNLDLPFIIECFFMNSINQQNRGEDAVRKEYHVDNVNEWKRIDFVVDATDTSEYASKVTPYIAVNFWSNTKNVPKVTDANGSSVYPTCHAYICKPMMEEGDTYSGWTLSEDDYDYVGGNILDNTRSLEKSGNLEIEDSEIINEGYEYAYAVAHSNNTTSAYIEMLQWDMVGRINDRQDYMFSFLAKGTGVVSTYLWKDGTPRFFVESSNNKHDDVSPDGNVDFELTNEWKRYWVHYHLNTSSEHPLPEKLLIRCYSGNDVYICQPKLEIGATMTEFTERKTDLVDKASLKKAGIEITTDKVKLYGDKVEVVTTKVKEDGTKEDTTTTMFYEGKLNADLIETEHIYAKSKKNGDIAGHFGYYDTDAAYDLGESFPLWVGASTAADASFRVSKDGTMYAKNATIGTFMVDYGIWGGTGYFTQNIDDSYGKYAHYLFAGIGSGSGSFLISGDKVSGDGSGFESYVRICDHGGTFTDSNGNKYDNINKPALQVRQSLSSYPSKDATAIGAEIKAHGRSDGESVALEVSATNSLKNHAIKITSGDIAGFRTCILSISQSINLNDADKFTSGMVLICKNTNDITITLPSRGSNGDNFMFIKAGNGKVNVVHPTNSSLYHQANGNTGSFTSTSRYEHVHFVYYNLEWYSECSRD